jgi:hypothetical protein
MDDDNDEIESTQGAEDEGPREKWDRRPDESQRAHAAFKMWLESEKRSLTDVARSSKFACSVANLSRWSRLHDWQGRAWAWDVRREQEEREQLARARSAMRARHLKIAMALQSVGTHALAELQGRIEQKLPTGLSPDEARAMIDAGARMERQTLGEGKEGRFTKISVIVSGYEDDADYERALSKREDGEPLHDNLILDDGGKPTPEPLTR